MSGHTRGNLYIIPQDPQDPDGDYPLQIGVRFDGKTEGESDQLVAEVYGRSVEEMEANARLFIAAPQLLEVTRIVEPIVEPVIRAWVYQELRAIRERAEAGDAEAQIQAVAQRLRRVIGARR